MIQTIPAETMYFPSLTGKTGEKTISDLKMESKRSPASLLDYLELKHSKSFIILVNGKNCYGKLFQRSYSTNWYLESAGKTLTSTTGTVQQGLLNINNKVSIHRNRWAGQGNTSAQKLLITHPAKKILLTMTRTLTIVQDDVDPASLIYADAGSRRYHRVYVKLLRCCQKRASGQTWAIISTPNYMFA